MTFPILPSESPAEAARRANLEALLAIEGIDAVYRVGGVDPGVDLKVILSDKPRDRGQPSGLSPPVSQVRSLWLLCPAGIVGGGDQDSNRVTTLGGNDTFEVHAARLGMPGGGSVRLRVKPHTARYCYPEWVCEVTA